MVHITANVPLTLMSGVACLGIGRSIVVWARRTASDDDARECREFLIFHRIILPGCVV